MSAVVDLAKTPGSARPRVPRRLLLATLAGSLLLAGAGSALLLAGSGPFDPPRAVLLRSIFAASQVAVVKLVAAVVGLGTVTLALLRLDDLQVQG